MAPARAPWMAVRVDGAGLRGLRRVRFPGAASGGLFAAPTR
jgi:hypothetical protein